MIFFVENGRNGTKEMKKGIKRRSYHTLASKLEPSISNENSLPNEISEFKLKIQEKTKKKTLDA